MKLAKLTKESMSQIKNRKQLKKKIFTVYKWLKINKPDLLDTYLPREWVNDPRGKKENLITLAQSGGSRPSEGKNSSVLEVSHARMLTKYTTKGRTYDPAFDKKIRRIRPEWFTDSVKLKKEQILELARSVTKRPVAGKHPLAAAFHSYTSEQNLAFDPEFTQELKALTPSWFKKPSQEKKNELIELAKIKGSKKPTQPGTLGKALSRYVNPKCVCFDASFVGELKSLAPHWFHKREPEVPYEESFKNLQNFFNKNSRLPIQASKNKEEKKLYRFMTKCCAIGKTHKPDVEAWSRNNGYGNLTTNKGLESKKEILEFIKKNKSKPHYASTDKNERNLADRLRYYCEEKRANDSDFREQVNFLCKELGI